jgi:hypothetical protein
MTIDASLFAHIENDSSLAGTYGLQGNSFINTTKYLSKYLDFLKISNESFPPEYSTLIQQMQYLVKVEEGMENMIAGRDLFSNLMNMSTLLTNKLLSWFSNQNEMDIGIAKLATKITKDMMSMQNGGKQLLPGGWYNNGGGHAMIYQFELTDDGIDFTVINAGAGLEYHAKKSSRQKELYNPLKTWHIPRPNTITEQTELVNFIMRLLKPRLPSMMQQNKKPLTAKVLYEEILPTISYLKGTEVDANHEFPEHGYTGGQLSGTCSQRSIHQMLKIKSTSAKIYEQFIFKYKQYALFDYANACLTGDQPFNSAVAEQINLAIENNLKILNTPKLFNKAELKKHSSTLSELQTKISDASIKTTQSIPKEKEHIYLFTVKANPLAAPSIDLNQHFDDTCPPEPIDLGKGEQLLDNLSNSISNINQIKDPVTQFNEVQQLLLQLPLCPSLPSNSGFYRELRTISDFIAFQNNLTKIQFQLLSLQKKWHGSKTTRFSEHYACGILP